MSVTAAVARIAELQAVFAPPAPPAPAPAPAVAGAPAGGTGSGATPFAANLQAAQSAGTGGAEATPAAPGSYPHLTGDLDASPEILGRLEALAARRGQKFEVTSGLRTVAEQQRLWDNRASNPFPVARPGSSLHNSGRAVDVTIGGRPIQDVIPAGELRAAGLVPLAGDAVHVELPR